MPNTPRTPKQPKPRTQDDLDRDVEDDRTVQKGPGGSPPTRTDVEREMPSAGDTDIERSATEPGAGREMDERRPHREG